MVKFVVNLRDFFVLQLKEMFRALNVPYIVSDGEAEALCAQLNAAGVSILLRN